MDPTLASILETTGLAVFIYYLIRGLRAKISALEATIAVQHKTLDVMERRVQETEKVGSIYRNLIADLPADIDNFKTVISKTKDETILELKNQNDIAQRKLRDAQQQIENSRNSPEVIKLHMQVLKRLLSGGKLKDGRRQRDFDLTPICEYNGRSLENCVPAIIDAATLEEFLKKIGFSVHRSDDSGIVKRTFDGKTTPSGAPLESAVASQSYTGGWHLLANNEFYANDIRLSELKDEFSTVKTLA
jgi:uncharacterized coiled-coil protein SlyX